MTLLSDADVVLRRLSACLLVLSKQVIAKDTVVANEKKAVVQKEEEVCNAQAAQASSLKQSCEHDLAEAIPILEQAIKALSALDKNSIVEVRGSRGNVDWQCGGLTRDW